MSANEAHYLQLLRDQMGLFEQLAEIRSEKNDLHDAKMRAWDQHRPELTSNAQFEELWQATKAPERYEFLRKREGEILSQLDKMKVVLEHLRFAGLDDVAA